MVSFLDKLNYKTKSSVNLAIEKDVLNLGYIMAFECLKNTFKWGIIFDFTFNFLHTLLKSAMFSRNLAFQQTH